MNKTLHYLFDPLCGWCYGATPAVDALLETPGVSVRLLPTGLFAGSGARPMDDAFAAYAWSNDQRIERLTGQGFSLMYRDRVLDDRVRLFDSGPATLALTAVSLDQPRRELQTLKAIQQARYLDGLDVTSLEVLADLLTGMGLRPSAARLALPDTELLAANRARIGEARALMQEFGARGVPALVAEVGVKRWLMDPAVAYSNPKAMVAQLATA